MMDDCSIEREKIGWSMSTGSILFSHFVVFSVLFMRKLEENGFSVWFLFSWLFIIIRLLYFLISFPILSARLIHEFCFLGFIVWFLTSLASWSLFFYYLLLDMICYSLVALFMPLLFLLLVIWYLFPDFISYLFWLWEVVESGEKLMNDLMLWYKLKLC